MYFEFDNLKEQKAKLKVVGIGGAGGNAVNRMITAGMTGVDFVVINTDAQDLDNNGADKKIQIGRNLTKGLGAGAKSDVGRQAVEADKDAIASMLEGSDMTFITAGMGGGTGTGASPLVAQMSKEMGILTVGIVTLPFTFEGPKRTSRAMSGITELQKVCDTLIVIPNQKLMSLVDKSTTIEEGFKIADSILLQAAKGISDLINIHGIINLDFADVQTVMKDMGEAIMGTGIASGEERAVLAAQQAISSPLLDNTSINGAQGILVNISGGNDLSLHEIEEATSIIFEEAGPDANIILGAVIDQSLENDIRVTVIATGFNKIGKYEDIQDVISNPLRKPEEKRNPMVVPSDQLNITVSARRNQSDDDKPFITSPVSDSANTKYVFDDSSLPFKDKDIEVPAFIRRQQL